MDQDMLMAKSALPGWTNLAVGEPGFLQEGFLEPLAESIAEYESIIDHGEPAQSYPPPMGDSHLLLELSRWMLANVARQNINNQHIVVANGAKQALLAAMHAHGETKVAWMATHRYPCWPSHRTLAHIAGLGFCSPKDLAWHESGLSINTSPNNPDGSFDETPCDIWDAAYAHSVYGFDDDYQNRIPDHTTSVWSAAKLFGMSGDRIGWLVTSNPDIAKHASEYIESTTSGVSIFAQYKLECLLKFIRNSPHLTRQGYDDARRFLYVNYVWVKHCFPEVDDSMGMFAWVKTNDKIDAALAHCKIQVLPGSACGMNGWIRINVGARMAVVKDAMQRLKEVLG